MTINTHQFTFQFIQQSLSFLTTASNNRSLYYIRIKLMVQSEIHTKEPHLVEGLCGIVYVSVSECKTPDPTESTRRWLVDHGKG